MTAQTFDSITGRHTAWEERGHHGLLRAGSTFLSIALIGIVLGAFAANDVLLAVGSLTGVVGAFLLSCRQLTGPQRVEQPDLGPSDSGRPAEHPADPC
ncbi:hypothetical protein [Raineyella sp. LH-20]|uniref:hypothetical protein n=1 Tax=Raineyella sp. LH-20 TaxID=3081204 RepID=UPI002955932A|nr:hypothetical protein [Raineyella sp. LH-20]WOP19264.1 hypothetical protein R0146_03060 [Raineyella sp. LH-20]